MNCMVIIANECSVSSIIICIQKFCGLSISDQPLSTLSEWWMMRPYHIPALLAGNFHHVDLFTSYLSILPNLFTILHPAHSPWFPWRIINKFKYLNDVHQFCGESYAVGCMDKCRMTVVIQPDSYSTLTAPSMTRMTSLTHILLVNLITNLGFGFSLNSNWHTDMEFIGCHTGWFGF